MLFSQQFTNLLLYINRNCLIFVKLEIINNIFYFFLSHNLPTYICLRDKLKLKMKYFTPEKYFVLLIGILFATTSYGQTYTQVAANQMDENTVAFTYKVEGLSPTTIQDDQKVNQNNVTTKAEIFLAFKGIRRAQYDQATGLITVIASTENNLPVKFEDDQVARKKDNEGKLLYEINNDN